MVRRATEEVRNGILQLLKSAIKAAERKARPRWGAGAGVERGHRGGQAGQRGEGALAPPLSRPNFCDAKPYPLTSPDTICACIPHTIPHTTNDPIRPGKSSRLLRALQQGGYLGSVPGGRPAHTSLALQSHPTMRVSERRHAIMDSILDGGGAAAAAAGAGGGGRGALRTPGASDESGASSCSDETGSGYTKSGGGAGGGGGGGGSSVGGSVHSGGGGGWGSAGSGGDGGAAAAARAEEAERIQRGAVELAAQIFDSMKASFKEVSCGGGIAGQ